MPPPIKIVILTKHTGSLVVCNFNEFVIRLSNWSLLSNQLFPPPLQSIIRILNSKSKSETFLSFMVLELDTLDLTRYYSSIIQSKSWTVYLILQSLMGETYNVHTWHLPLQIFCTLCYYSFHTCNMNYQNQFGIGCTGTCIFKYQMNFLIYSQFEAIKTCLSFMLKLFHREPVYNNSSLTFESQSLLR